MGEEGGSRLIYLYLNFFMFQYVSYPAVTEVTFINE